MNRKNFLYRLFWLLALLLAGVLLTYVLTFIILTALHGGDLTAALTGFGSRVGDLWLVQTVQAVCVFILPAVLLTRICREETASWLSWRRAGGLDLLVAALSVMAALPLVNVLVAWNGSWTLPAWLSEVETWLQEQEQAAGQVTQTMLGVSGLGGLVVNFAVIALLAGLGEEMMFRGALQRMLYEGFSSRRLRTGREGSSGAAVASVWLAAFLFSAIHLQFYGLIPRMLLGAWFGYLLLWTDSLWVPVTAHAVNNALSLFFAMADRRGWMAAGSVDSLGLGRSWWLCLVSVMLLVGCVWYFRRGRS
ncbi:MAG: CPBP family intramembrane metalloprotease [Bacteroidales bacterium]|nr:CPBP family intramembrane metalloprotease [Bacteroidales bacterium]